MNTLVDRLVPARLGRSFRWLLASSWTTNLGDGIALAAGPLLVASLTRDPFLISLAAVFGWAPPLVFGLYAGVLSDRRDRRRIVLAANAARVALLTGLIAAIATGTLSATVALLALGLLATTEVFADNTSATLPPMLVHRDDLVVANARLQTGFITLNQLAGPPIGAALFAAGTVWPFATEVILDLAGLLMVTRLVLPAHGRAADAAVRNMRQDVVEGFRWTVRHPAVRTLLLTILIFNVSFGAAWSVLVLYAQQQLGLGPVGFGLLSTVSALGGLLGTGLYGRLTSRIRLGDLMRIGLIIETLTHLILALTRSAWVASVVFFLFGAHAFVWGTTSVTVRQRAVPQHLQGRVGSLNTLCVYGGLVVGAPLGGALAGAYGVAAPFWFAFAASAVFVVLLWRELTRIATEDAAQPAVA
ncbi:MFS transporter [Catellatospora sp. TT07R-123]|uniref:MFS transporter n=1 Tax=Catellatospora sp. TT07R-123 TaxID=2733863 RepID=UPI001B13DEA1|nr:MFS transporter [Catellatospora sp. TT07R-123]GHJ42848.1 MFS transporter [Catellatospora sp. TT07R-123]